MSQDNQSTQTVTFEQRVKIHEFLEAVCAAATERLRAELLPDLLRGRVKVRLPASYKQFRIYNQYDITVVETGFTIGPYAPESVDCEEIRFGALVLPGNITVYERTFRQAVNLEFIQDTERDMAVSMVAQALGDAYLREWDKPEFESGTGD